MTFGRPHQRRAFFFSTKNDTLSPGFVAATEYGTYDHSLAQGFNVTDL
jgi:hypothetical protein